jgi:ABC-2 type transport system ATP-binding protein
VTVQRIISVENLTKYFGNNIGVKDISFEVEKGEIFGFLGPNGAGKTTTIRLLLDLLRPSSGKARIFGMDVNQHSTEILARCGYLPGEFSAYSNFSGIEFFKLIAGFRKISPIIDKNLIERLGLSDHDLSRKIKHLSHGTVQKIGIIQAFFHHPELLILDEPTTGLDPLIQNEFYDLVFENQKNGCTIFISSHNLAEVEMICTRLAIVRHGQLVGLESMKELKEKADRIVEITLSEPSENIDIPGAFLLDHRDLNYTFRFKGNIVELMKSISNLPLADIVIKKPAVSDVFMNYYRDQKHE